MNIRQKKQRKRIFIIIVVFIVSLIIFRDAFNLLRSGINNLVLPVKILIYKSTYRTKSTFDNLRDINNILKENIELKKENYALRFENVKLQTLINENERLKDLLDLKEGAGIDFVIANISFKDPLSVYDEFFIDLGSDDDIKENMVVLNRDILLGRISKVYKKRSIVELISKQNLYTSVLIGEEKYIGILKGENSNRLIIEYVVNDAQIKVGDKVYTSGISDIYPKGQYIGEITSVVDKEGGLFKEITLTLPFNIFELNQVVILK